MQQKKKTPLVIFTGLAVVAAGTLGAMITGNYPGAPETPPAVTAPAEAPAQAPVAEAPAAAETQQPAGAEQQSAAAPAAVPASAEQSAATQAEAPVAAPAENQVATAPAQDAATPPEAAPAAATESEMPSFDTVNVMPSGETVVAGRGKPGSEVVLKFSGVEVGRATAGADGSFAIVPDKPLPQGAGDLTLESAVGGKTLTSKDQIAVVVDKSKPALVAKVAPEAPTKIVQAPTATSGEVPKDVQLSAVDYDADGNIVFQGRVTPGGAVRFYVDNKVAGDVTADALGNWLFKGTAPIAPGTHTLRADEIDGTGKVISRAELPFLREEAGKVIASTEAQPAAAQPEATGTDQVATAPAAQTETPAAAPEAGTAAGAGTEPQAGAQPAVVASARLPSRIVIQPGNNLWRISREVYGKGRLFTVIWEANRDQIKNPNRIYPGQILAAPKS
jgi:nucleoid-associated protein YgaU